MKARRVHSFGRALFQILLLGIVLPASLIWGVGHLTAGAAVSYLWGGLSEEIADHTVQRTLRYLETGATALDYNDRVVGLDLVDLADRRSVLRYLLAGLEANPNVTWYSLATADGAYLSAYRPPGGGARLTWREQVDGGALYRDFHVEPDGSWTALEEKTKAYDPRTRGWYTAALEARGKAVWSDPFLFASGPPGFILSRAVPGPGDAPLGVWAIEYEMSYVSEFLGQLEIGKTGRAYLVTAAGEVIGHPLFVPTANVADCWIVCRNDEGKKIIAQAATHRDARLRGAFAVAGPAATQLGSSFDVDGETYLLAATPFPASTGLDWKVLIVVPESDILGSIHRNSLLTGIAAVLIAMGFLVLGYLYARRSLTQPLSDIAHDLEVMAQLDTEAPTRVDVSRISEVEGMVRAREAMRGGLRSFTKYVPAELVRELMASGQEARLGGLEREMTVLFSDIASFTRISEELGDPAKLVDALSEYLGAMSDIIAKHGGTVDKYIGDAIMAFWGAPREHPTHALSAARAAWESQATLARLREAWSAEGKPEFRARIGVNTGEVLVGNLGSAARMNYTVMGDAVNLASRIEGVCSLYGLELAIGESTWEAAKAEFEGRPIDCVEVKGRVQPVVFYELLGPRGEVAPDVLAFATTYTAAFAHYMAGRFAEARAGFDAARALQPADIASAQLAERSAVLERDPPANWTGAVRLTQKKAKES